MSRDVHQSPPRRLEALTTLRFFAALHVTLFHLLAAAGSWGLPAPVEIAIRAGPSSVSFFFVLSGFILTQAYASRPPHLAPWAYARSRFARLYPLYALGLVLMAPSWFAHATSVGATASTTLLLQAWWPPWSNAWNPPAWSLSVETFFYVLFPLLLPWTLRTSKRALWAVAGSGWALMLLVALGYHLLQPDGLARVDASSTGFWLDALKFHPLVRLPEFVVGLALGRAARDGATLTGTKGLLATAALLVGLLLSDRVPFPLLHNGLLTPLFVLVVLSTATTPGTSRVRAFLERRPLVVLGEASYALYILQTPVLGLVHGVLKRVAPGTPYALFSVLGLAATLVVSLLAWRFVERPSREWLLSVGKKKT